MINRTRTLWRQALEPNAGAACLLIVVLISASVFGRLAVAEQTAMNKLAEAKPGAVAQVDVDFSELFVTLLLPDDEEALNSAMQQIRDRWHDGLIPMSLEVMSFTGPGMIYDELDSLLRQSVARSGTKADEKSFNQPSDYYFWLWNQEIAPTSGYADFKADLYRRIDPRFEQYFKGRAETARVRLDEMRWGGVKQDGIPPLRNPKMIAAPQATYLDDSNVVFGIELNGDARAYPKRILAWHEMFTDTIGGVEIAGVYCTLCGTVIPFRTKHNDVSYRLGTSGFLYRSNKLMYDRTTQSLWSTTRGEPVLGPLVDKRIQLSFESVVTTTWGAWRKRHPETTVLSLDTGHRRDYGEGVAYAQYFGSDALMFNTPFNDTRLANKREILALRFAAAPDQQLAIDTGFLIKNPVYSGQVGLQKFVVLTDSSGANRVYDRVSNLEAVNLVRYDGDSSAWDQAGTKWQVRESWLESADGRRLVRLPYHRAFWFGWRAAFPKTQLIK